MKMKQVNTGDVKRKLDVTPKINVLCTICARGGSKGIKHKNIRMVAGKPLIAHTIEIAKAWNGFDELVVSTDSQDIIDVALAYGAQAPFVRPASLANDTAGKVAVVRHALQYMEEATGVQFDYVVDLDATSPLRRVEDIVSALNQCIAQKLDIVYSVNEARKNPYFNMVEINEEGLPVLCKQLPGDVLSRQSAPKVYELNASIYVYERAFLLSAVSVFGGRAGIHVMDKQAIDIDEESDLLFLEYVMNQRND